jgi:phosphatidate cytidylyltransferase
MLWQRLLFGTLMIAGVLGLTVLDAWLAGQVTGQGAPGQPPMPLLCALPLTALVLVLVVLTTWELGRLCRTDRSKPATFWAAFVAALLVVSPWIDMQASMAAGSTAPSAGHYPAPPMPLTAFLLTGCVLGTGLLILLRRRTEGALNSMAVTLWITLFVGLLGSFAVRLRCTDPGPAGAVLLVYVILTVKSGDIGAYFVGKLLGKHKLAPWVSPAKTIEGGVGALAASAAVAVGGVALWEWARETVGAPPLTVAQALVFGPVMAVSGHLGDLIESAIKRDLQIKDSGRLIPAFGGLLDLVDSPLFALPIAWWLLTFWGSMH